MVEDADNKMLPLAFSIINFLNKKKKFRYPDKLNSKNKKLNPPIHSTLYNFYL